MKKNNETIKISGLETGYISKKGNTVITRDIDASLESGELTCLLGPNGAGKSTLLKTLTAFIPPIQGDIFIEGKSLKDYSAPELAKVIGVVLTEKLSISNMTVEELISMGRSPYTGFWGKMSEYDKMAVEESINLVNINNLRGRMVQTLSDGERQKVKIAKALAQETPVIFLDEPTAFLDYPSKVEILQLLKRLAIEKDKTVFLSTHDMELALQIADKVWLIDKPHGVTIGTPEDLALNGEMNRYFHSDGVVFDIDNGLFKISQEMRGSVSLTGEGQHLNMVRKALTRRGISTAEKDSSVFVEATPRCLSVNGRDVKSIAELLDEIDSIIDNDNNS